LESGKIITILYSTTQRKTAPEQGSTGQLVVSTQHNTVRRVPQQHFSTERGADFTLKVSAFDTFKAFSLNETYFMFNERNPQPFG
jgi:hypothetical protein